MADRDDIHRLPAEVTDATEVKQEQQEPGAQESDVQGATANAMESQGRSSSGHLPAIAAAVAAVTALLVGVWFWLMSGHGDWCGGGPPRSAATWFGLLAAFALAAAGLAGLGALSALIARRLAKPKSGGSVADGCGCAAAFAAFVIGVVFGLAFVFLTIVPGC